MIKDITEKIKYIPAHDDPLSADVGIVIGEKNLYLFDLGDGEETLSEVMAIVNEECMVKGKGLQIVFSHFHGDHIKNVFKLHELTKDISDRVKIIQSATTLAHVKSGAALEENILIEDGVHIEIVKLPSSHAKGCLMMVVDSEYAFVGDGTYCASKNGEYFFNAGVLKEEIEVLKRYEGTKVCISHDKKYIRPMRAVIKQLEGIYSKREKDKAYIVV